MRTNSLWRTHWTTVRAHAVPIAVSVTISVALCRASVVVILAIIAIAVAIFIWMGGWKIEIRKDDKDQHSTEEIR